MNSNEQEQRQQAREKSILAHQLAEQDLTDISTLKRTAAFERYFLRKLRQRHQQLGQQVLETEMLPQEREIARRLYLEYRELLAMVDRDEANQQKVLRGS